MGPMGPMGSMIIPQRSPGTKWKMKHRLLPNIVFRPHRVQHEFAGRNRNATQIHSGIFHLEQRRFSQSAHSLGQARPLSQPDRFSLRPIGSFFSSLGIFPELHATKMLPCSPSPRSGVFTLHRQQKLPIWVDSLGSWVARPIATSMWSPKRIYPICAKHWWQRLKKLPVKHGQETRDIDYRNDYRMVFMWHFHTGRDTGHLHIAFAHRQISRQWMSMGHLRCFMMFQNTKMAYAV